MERYGGGHIAPGGRKVAPDKQLAVDSRYLSPKQIKALSRLVRLWFDHLHVVASGAAAAAA